MALGGITLKNQKPRKVIDDTFKVISKTDNNHSVVEGNVKILKSMSKMKKKSRISYGSVFKTIYQEYSTGGAKQEQF